MRGGGTGGSKGAIATVPGDSEFKDKDEHDEYKICCINFFWDITNKQYKDKYNNYLKIGIPLLGGGPLVLLCLYKANDKKYEKYEKKLKFGAFIFFLVFIGGIVLLALLSRIKTNAIIKWLKDNKDFIINWLAKNKKNAPWLTNKDYNDKNKNKQYQYKYHYKFIKENPKYLRHFKNIKITDEEINKKKQENL